MTIFRAISEAEKNDLEIHNEFRPKIGAYEGKLFAESPKDATIFGKNFYPFDSEAFFIVEVNIDDDFSRRLGYEFTDQGLGVGLTIAVDREKLNDFNYNMTFNILDYVAFE